MTAFGDGVFKAVTLGNGLGLGVSLHELRSLDVFSSIYSGDTNVDTSSGVYQASHLIGDLYGRGVVLVVGANKAGFRVEANAYKNADTKEWVRNLHFHLGKSRGLDKHHLPYELSRWWKNFKNVFGQGK